MATELKAASEEVKVDLFEDDDEFEEFEINEGMACNYLYFLFLPLFGFLYCRF